MSIPNIPVSSKGRTMSLTTSQKGNPVKGIGDELTVWLGALRVGFKVVRFDLRDFVEFDFNVDSN